MNYNRRRQGKLKADRVLRVWTARHRHAASWVDACAKYLVHTRVPCSCPMCGNPRRHFGERTVQERREDERMAFELQEVGA